MKKKSFTLIELLVVIAIIAILASMLFGAVRNARSRIKGTVCLSNLRTIITAFNAYAVDNDNYYVYGTTWMFAINQYMKGGSAAVPANVNECVKLYCPDSPNAVPATPYVNSYGWIPSAWAGSEDLALRVTQISNKAQKAVVFEAPLTNMWHYSHETWQSRYIDETNIFTRYGNPPAYIPGVGRSLGVTALNLPEQWNRDFYDGRHALTVNISYADGHAETNRAGDTAAQYHKVKAQLATGYGTTQELFGNIFAPKAQ